MDWYLDFKLWSNNRLYCEVLKSPAERQKQANMAVVARSVSRGCTILYVDFKGEYRCLVIEAAEGV